MMSLDIECPYCGEENEIEGENIIYAEDALQETECGECGNTFSFNLYISHSLMNPEKMPCRNGGDHEYEYEKIRGSGYYDNFKRCKYCEDEIMINKDLGFDCLTDSWVKK